MELIIKGRAEGKTTELIKKSAETGFYIVCINQSYATGIFHYANKMGLKIPFPLTFEEFLSKKYYARGVRGFLIDDADLLFEAFCDRPVMAITMTDHTKHPEMLKCTTPRKRRHFPDFWY